MTPSFCPSCGKPAASGDRFCRHCGARLDDTAPPAGVSGEAREEGAAPAARPWRRRLALIGAFAALALAAGAVAFLIVRGGGDGEADAAAALATERERVTPQFDELMQRRDSFFTLERRYLAALGDAREALADYRRKDRDYAAEVKRIDDEFADEFDECYRYTAVPCPSPDYPDVPAVPSVSKQTRAMRTTARRLGSLRAELTSTTPLPRLRVLYDQLMASIDALKDEADHNADVLDEAVTPAKGDATGTVDNGRLRTLREDEALPSIKEMNRAAVDVVKRLELPLTRYDLPGGRDLDSDDHSDEL